MRKTLLSFALLLLAFTTLTSFTTRTELSQQQKRYALYGVAFYNLENLFDTIHDAGKNDFEYLPNGTMKWGKMKYEAKLHNMSRVLSELCTDKLPMGAAVIGVSERENANVLDDLLKQPSLAKRGYKYVDVPSYDRRGVECAFFYNPRLFQMERYFCVQYNYGPTNKVDDPMLGFTIDNKGKVQAIDHLQGDTTYITRGFLVMEGRMAGEKMFFIVNHWPSRAAGDEVRQRAGWQVRQLKEERTWLKGCYYG